MKWPVRRTARGDLRHDRELAGYHVEVRRHDRIAVDRTVGERRNILGRDDVLGEHAANRERYIDGDGLEWSTLGEHELPSFDDRDAQPVHPMHGTG